MNRKKILFNSFVKSQFNYCPLIWMFCSRTRNNQINSIQERALRITYNNYINSYSELLQMYKVKSVHQNNIHFLMIEIYRFLNGLSPPIMDDIFRLRENRYNLRNFRLLECHLNYFFRSMSKLAFTVLKLLPIRAHNYGI